MRKGRDSIDSYIVCRKIVGGLARGRSVVTRQPINFLTMLDPKTGIIKDPDHELYGKSLRSKVLIFPNAVGSSVGAYVLYSLKMQGTAPSAIICTHGIDIITASACAISEIPTVSTAGRQTESVSRIKSGIQVLVDADDCHIEFNKTN
ncbi:MAG: DUF126 domain-containing protein [Nitrososphaeraceae archaeon]|nr:DUF126 domain-containing protein [Nitrososphaeraceae archaeon]